MPAKLDLTGQKYGKLTVLRESEKRIRNRVTWECQCDCGNPELVLVLTQNLRSGNTQSCGCLKRKNIAGQKFGRLTAIRATQERRHGSIVWECQCDCGNPLPVFATVEGLRVGDNTSCGCYNSSREKFAETYRVDLTGNKYGKLTVIAATDKRTPKLNVIWKCLCECGNQCYVSTNHLQTGNTKSCGCLSGYSIGELKIKQILEEHNIKYKAQFIFSDLPNRKYDFAILDKEDNPIQLIEFDGEQHYIETPFFGITLEEQQRIDALKTAFALQQGVPLIRIPYWKRETLTIDDLRIKKE